MSFCINNYQSCIFLLCNVFSIGSPSITSRQVNGKIEENKTSFIEKTKMTANHKNDSAQSSPNGIKSNGVKVKSRIFNDRYFFRLICNFN